MARTVLLADDSVTAQNMGRRILMDAGYEVITVNNGSAALKKIHENRPDLIVLDVYMPGYGGLEVCQRLKESGETMRIPVLLTVGKMEPFKTEEARRVRADGHIVKPFDASELLAALTKLEDRIVPQGDGRGRKEKKARFWHVDEVDPARIPEPLSDSVVYLAEVKEKQAQAPRQAGEEDVSPDAVGSPVPVARPAKPARDESAPELPVVPDMVGTPESVGAASAPDSTDSVQDRPASVESAAAPAAPDSAGAGSTQTSELASSTTAAPANASSGNGKAPRWVAESVALSPEEAALELEREMQQSQAASMVTSPAPAEHGSSTMAQADGQEPQGAILGAPVVSKEAGSGATFAAAAGASGSAQSSAVTALPADAPAAFAAETEAPAPPETAAAWENWQRIRDSVMNSQNTSAIAESVAQAAQSGAAPQKNRSNEPAADPALEGAALASIVDTVLAELKPKLMEEIAKKLKK